MGIVNVCAVLRLKSHHSKSEIVEEEEDEEQFIKFQINECHNIICYYCRQ